MRKPIVAIIMGSDSDLPIMQEAAAFLDQVKVPYDLDIVSAHRTPDKLYKYSAAALKKGVKVIIAGAGGSAHLPGMVAAITPLPVIGVPIKTKNMDGVDSLFSIVQMPPGIPVATVAINGAKNAGILAAEILGLSDKLIQNAVVAYKKSLNSQVVAKSSSLKKIGYKKYLQQ